MMLLDDSQLPPGFKYPSALRRLVERQLTRIEPWWILDAGLARERLAGLVQRYPGKALVPFAKREDNDGLACFDCAEPGAVVLLHDFAADAWDRRRMFPDFYAWLRQAIDDMIELDRLEDE